MDTKKIKSKIKTIKTKIKILKAVENVVTFILLSLVSALMASTLMFCGYGVIHFITCDLNRWIPLTCCGIIGVLLSIWYCISTYRDNFLQNSDKEKQNNSGESKD